MPNGLGPIGDLTTSWEGHSMEEVEDFIKGQFQNIIGGNIMTTAVNIVGTTVRSFISSDEVVTFQYKVNNLVNNDYDANFTVAIMVGERALPVFKPSPASADTILTTPNLAPYLAQIGSNTIPVTIQAYTDSNQSAIRTLTFTRMSATITTANSINNTDPNRLLFSVNFNTESAVLKTRFYGASGTPEAASYVETQKSITIIGQVYVDVPYAQLPTDLDGRYAGAHKVEAWLELSDGTSKSETIITSFIATTNGNEGDAYITFEAVTGAKQNDYTNIRFSIYNVGKGEHDTYPVYLKRLNASSNQYDTVAEREVTNSNINTWRYLVPYTENTLQIAVPSTDSEGNVLYNNGQPVIAASVLIDFSADPTSVSWEPSDNPTIYLTAQGRTNTDSNVDSWKDLNSGYEMEFEDVAFADSSSGWVDQNAFKLIGSSRMRIKNFYPFYNNSTFGQNVRGGGLLNHGMTMKMSFMVTDVSNPDEKVVSCYDETSQIGFYITGDAIFVNIGAKLNSDPRESQTITGHNCRRFSANTRIDLTMTLQPYYDESRRETKHEVRYYINGEIAGFGVVSSNTLTQSLANRTLIEFGGNGAAFYLYDFRFYDKYLTAFEVLQTRTMDLDTSAAINACFTKNNFYELSGTNEPVITLERALEYGKYMAAQGHVTYDQNLERNIGNFAVSVVTDLCNAPEFIGKDKKKVTNTTDPQSFYLFRFSVDASGNGIIDPDLTIWIEGPTGGALRFRRQGTSTLDATKGNVRVDVREECHVHHWDSLTQSFKAEYDTVGRNAPVWQIPNSAAISCYLLTMKKNPNESTQARNLPTAKWYEDCSRYLAGINTNNSGGTTYGYEDILTPPQRKELNTIARLNPTLSRHEQIAKIRIRQTVDGVPGIAFEMVRTTEATIQRNPLLAQTSFGGQFDLITDKTNMDVFGFGGDGRTDDDFSVEWRNNQSAVCNFHTPDITSAGSKKSDGTDGNSEIEYRYPDIDSVAGGANATIGLDADGPIQRLFDFVCNCSPYNVNYKYEKGVESPSNGRITINGSSVVDNVANRNRKFREELGQYVVVNQFLFNAIAIDAGLMCDQDVKNQFFTYLTGEMDGNGNKLLRLLGYDFDSSWGCDNDNYFRFLYTVLYSDSCRCSFSRCGHGGRRGSDLWQLIFDNFANEIATMARYLYAGNLLTADGFLAYMHENQVDMYNEIQYNANAEYSYTESSGDYEKAHGSAREHNEWFVRGRLYFFSGKTFTGEQSGDFGTGMASFNVTTYDNLTEPNKYYNRYDDNGELKDWAIDVTAYERTYAYLVVDVANPSGGLVEVNTTYNASGMPTNIQRPVTTLKAPAGIVGQADTRFRFFGGKHIKTINDLSHWYISKINQWGDLINLEEINIGRVAQVYYLNDNDEPVYGDYVNPSLSDLNLGSQVFGSCKVLNLAGCTNMSGSLDLTKFPILERFEGVRMSATTEVVFPAGSSLRVAHLPANLTTLTIKNKKNLTELTYQGYSHFASITCEECNQYAAQTVINLLSQIIQ